MYFVYSWRTQYNRKTFGSLLKQASRILSECEIVNDAYMTLFNENFFCCSCYRTNQETYNLRKVSRFFLLNIYVGYRNNRFFAIQILLPL